MVNALRVLAGAVLLVASFLTGTAQAGSVQYVYDGLGRLIAVVDETGATSVYTYDAAGNILSVSGTGGGAGQLLVLSFAPDHGRVGDSVAIYGSKFVPVAAQNTVSFNGTPAVVSAATATALTVTVPAGATSGPVSVSNVNGTAASAGVFTVVETATISAVTPNVVPQGFISRVQISGAGLRYSTAVTFTQPGIAANLVPGGATDVLLGVDLRVTGSVPAGDYPFNVFSAAGSAGSGAVTVTVGVQPVGVSLSVSKAVSAFMPHPALAAPPSGGSSSISRATSVFLPQPALSAPPSGGSTSVSRPTSVFLPYSAQVPPQSGPTMSVGSAVSVSMP